MQIKTTVAVCAVLAAACASPACAQSEAEAKGFACSFTDGTTWTFESGAFKSGRSHPLEFTITGIDLERQTAQLGAAEAGKPPTQLKIVRAINANHFLEVVNEGFLNLTTVYDKDPTSGTYPAVHSRHFGVLGQPIVAQYAGTCTEK
ncbi:MAG: hypothetical protein WDN31_18550 [Hyphomicrobium sp.]